MQQSGKNLRRGLMALILVFIASVRLIAQNDKGKTDFVTAVDRINSATISFIHNEAGRKELADKVSGKCFTYECIYSTIPDDEKGSTGKVAKTINDFKNKYKSAEDFSKQVSKVIDFAMGKIKAKKRKGDVNALKADLEKIKTEAKNSYESGEESATPTTRPERPGDSLNAQPAAGAGGDNAASSTEIAPEETATDAAAPKQGGSSMMGWLGLVVALISLGVSVYAVMRIRSHVDSMAGRREESNTEGNNAKGSPAVQESSSNYRLLETQFNDEIKNIRSTFERKIDALQSEVTALKAAAKASAPVTAAPVVQAQASTPATAQASPVVESPPAHSPVNPSGPSLRTAAPVLEERPEPVVANTPPTTQNATTTTAQTAFFNTAQSSENSGEEVEMLPMYRYAGLAEPGGFWMDENFSDQPTMDSVFLIETYEDVPGRAFYSILNNPVVEGKVLANPEVYLSPYCRYNEEPDGMQHIKLDEEGILQRQADKWVIASKARVKFS